MTTPLFISESVPLEVRNIIKSLQIGAHVKYKHLEGYVAFVCDDYITICYKEYNHGDPTARRPLTQCCALVYNQYWDELELDDQYFLNKRNYTGRTNDHPGNELLPPVEQR